MRRTIIFGLTCFFASACGGSASKSTTPLENVAPENGGTPGAPATITADDALKFMPPSTELVFGVNVGNIASAEIAKPYLSRLEAAVPELGEIKAACDFDPMADTQWVLVGMTGNDGVFAMSTTLPRQSFVDCVRASAKKSGRDLVIEEADGIETWKEMGDELVVFWPSNNVVVMATNNRRDLLEQSKQELGLGADVSARVSGADRTGGMWGAGRLPANNGIGLPVQDLLGFELSVHAGDAVELSIRVEFASEAKAKEAEAGGQMALQMAKGHPMAQPFTSIIDNIKMIVEGQSLSANLQLSAKDIETLEKGLGGLAGMP